MKRFWSFLLALCLSLSFAIPVKAASMNIDYPITPDETLLHSADLMEEINQISSTTPRALSTIIIFVTGVVIGYVVDGVLIYETGYSGGQWVSYGLNALEEWRQGFWKGAAQYHMDSVTKKVSYAKNSAGCVLGTPQGTIYYCPMFDSSL